MTVAYDQMQYRGHSNTQSALCLEDKYEVIKDIGDGSFGSVVLGRVRTAGAHVVKRGTMVSSRYYSSSSTNKRRLLSRL
ncbi:hypothetical protein MRB53_040582 [Persea americana]|nr:hypothetical protein MRB53_040582 [Persea americana]